MARAPAGHKQSPSARSAQSGGGEAMCEGVRGKAQGRSSGGRRPHTKHQKKDQEDRRGRPLSSSFFARGHVRGYARPCARGESEGGQRARASKTRGQGARCAAQRGRPRTGGWGKAACEDMCGDGGYVRGRERARLLCEDARAHGRVGQARYASTLRPAQGDFLANGVTLYLT